MTTLRCPFVGRHLILQISSKFFFPFQVPDSMTMDIACMLPCSAVTAYNALKKTKSYMQRALSAHGRARLLVAGAGGVGLWAVQLAKVMYPDPKVAVLVADIGADRLSTAKEYGADRTILWEPSKETSENVATTTQNGEAPLDAVVDFVNNPMTVGIALGSLDTAGTLVSCGLFGGTYQLPLPMMVAKTLAIQGSRVASLSLLRELVELTRTTTLGYPSLEYFSIDDVNAAVTKMKERKINGRALFKFEK